MRRSWSRVSGLPFSPITIDGYRNIRSRPNSGGVTAEFRLVAISSSGNLAIFAAIRRASNNEKRAALSAAQVFLRAPPGDGAMVAKEQIVEGDVTLVTGAAIDHRYSFRNS